ncbi:hypothetical protein [Desulfococcus multivorans]|uniref:Uncharacterized protein n=1 Tax=Desulfococcus multivorans DSM 2059 TaxID=1121405 RepID=S7TF18_DESML|nr:hypothetical protein [Desulfococcus multivorans]AOY58763.1 conserved uncharacterized protein [Desulfococcus multivorans]AQV01047.2 hypothetical protein B2D07_09875 [Desulfococcus multivorans]EPR35195.1 hypothetical protein dsmv_3187 [Desulfococcus multivorans DSM 2059]SJZ49677.1 hypothetical protein SAMN02745446_00685 [Desulfococcus multivorans DSM 2059]
MIDVRAAVKIAFQLFQELYDTRRFEDVLLEAVELSQDRTTWQVTIGFYRRMPSVNLVESIGSKKYVRTYKTFHIDAATGDMIAMRQGNGEE